MAREKWRKEEDVVGDDGAAPKSPAASTAPSRVVPDEEAERRVLQILLTQSWGKKVAKKALEMIAESEENVRDADES